MSSAAVPSPDPRLAQALAAAERRLAMLERLAEIGMAIAGEITEKVVESPHRAGSGPDGARAFAQVSRAVRLTLMLAAKVEKAILAMRKGEIGLEAAVIALDAADPPATRGERLRAAVTPALEREAMDAEDAEMLRRRLDARLSESDDFGAFLSRPFLHCLKALCTDLGLDPEAVLAKDHGNEAADLILDNQPSPLAGEGGLPGPASPARGQAQGRMRGRRDPSVSALSGQAQTSEISATPHPTPDQVRGHLLPQGEKELVALE